MNQESGKSGIGIYAHDDFRLFLRDRYEAWKNSDRKARFEASREKPGSPILVFSMT